MTLPVPLQIALHGAVALAAALATVWWISRAAAAETGIGRRAVGKLLGNPYRFWIAIALLLAPSMLGFLLFRPVFRYLPTSGSGLIVAEVLTVGIGLLAGCFSGVAAACVAAPRKPGGEFLVKTAYLLAAALIILPSLFGVGASWVAYIVGPFLRVSCLLVAQLLLNHKMLDPQLSDPNSPPALPAEARSPVPALIIGFLPSAVALLLISTSSLLPNLSNSTTQVLLTLGCVVSLACCVAASILLFKRRTGLAILGGVLLLLLNAFIAFFSGCAALFTGASFH